MRPRRSTCEAARARMAFADVERLRRASPQCCRRRSAGSASQLAAACAAANCGICGGAGRSAGGRAANEIMVADASNVARPTAEAPIRVRRTMCTVLASRTSTRKTPHQRGRTEPRSLCLDGGNSPDLEVSRLMVSPRRRTIHGCGPAPDSHRLPLAGSTATACVARVRYHGGSRPHPFLFHAVPRRGS